MKSRNPLVEGLTRIGCGGEGVEVRVPHITGLGRFLRRFQLELDAGTVEPIWGSKDLQTGMDGLVTCEVFIKPSLFKLLGLPIDELQKKIFEYLQPALPRRMWTGNDIVVNVGVRVVLKEDEDSEPVDPEKLL